MSGGNLTAVLKQVGEMVLEDQCIPQPSENQVCLAMGPVGICGSDVHYWQHGAIGDFIVKGPLILGHESAGTVTKVGSGVAHLSVGDRVAVEPGVPCYKCQNCTGGRYNLCADIQFCATPPVDGSLRQYYCHEASFCYKLPDNVSLDEGALLEPLSVAVHACRRGNVRFGDRVVVCGAGPIGLVNMLVAKAAGATVLITDISQSRLVKAGELGADHVYHVTDNQGRVHAGAIEEEFGLADVVIECTGVESSIATGLWSAKPGATYVQVGYGKAEVMFPIVAVGVKEIDIKGIFRYANCYPIALQLIATGKINVKPLITHRYPLTQTLEAFQMSKEGTGIKVVIDCDKL